MVRLQRFIVRAALSSWPECGLEKYRVQCSQECVMEEPCLACTEGEKQEIPHLLRAFDTYLKSGPSKIKR